MSWFERRLCPDCAFSSSTEVCKTCGNTRDGGPTPEHECPPPFNLTTAKAMLGACQAGMIVSQRTKARILLAYKDQTPDDDMLNRATKSPPNSAL